MRRIVPVRQKEGIILRNILGRKDIKQVKRKNISGRKNGNFLEESSSKEKHQKSVLYAEG